jgi:hypothetical protein
VPSVEPPLVKRSPPDFLPHRAIRVGDAEHLVERRGQRLGLHDRDHFDRQRKIEPERAKQGRRIDARRQDDALCRNPPRGGHDTRHPSRGDLDR